MAAPLKLMCIFAHPDDESLGTGFTLAKYGAEGVETLLVCATRGERGWSKIPAEFPGHAAFGKIREAELRAAAQVLGINDICFLDYMDGELDRVDALEAIGKITREIRRFRPQVVLTFDPTGAYGHPDHIAISQYAMGAVVAAADIGYIDSAGYPPHRVPKVYYILDSERMVKMFQEVVGGIEMPVNGERRAHFGWPEWAATAKIDGSAYWDANLKAIACHQTQVSEWIEKIRRIPETHDPLIWSMQTYYRVYSLVNGSLEVETDLFAGLR